MSKTEAGSARQGIGAVAASPSLREASVTTEGSTFYSSFHHKPILVKTGRIGKVLQE